MSEIKYQNWYSKILFGKAFRNQHFIPIPPSFAEKALMHSIEKFKFPKNLNHISIEKPIFIVGLPRSGTSLLYNLICSHENAAYITASMNTFPQAPRAIEWLRKKLELNIEGERFFKDSIRVDFGSPSEPILYWKKWIEHPDESLYWEEKRIKDIPQVKQDEIYFDIKKIISSFDNYESKRFVCKFPIAQTELKLIQDLFPDVKFIHIVRDGRQVANSLVKLNKISNEQLEKINHPLIKSVVTYPRVKNLSQYIDEFGVNNIQTTARVWQDAIDLVNETKPHLNNFYELRYEDLLENPKDELERLFDYCEFSSPFDSNKEFMQEFNKIGKTTHKNNYGDFEVVENLAARVLKQYRYISE